MGTLGLGQVGAALNVSANYLDEAAALERLGYSAIWLPGGQIDDLDRLAEVAGATSAVPVGSAVISLDATRQVRLPACTHGWRPARPAVWSWASAARSARGRWRR